MAPLPYACAMLLLASYVIRAAVDCHHGVWNATTSTCECASGWTTDWSNQDILGGGIVYCDSLASTSAPRNTSAASAGTVLPFSIVWLIPICAAAAALVVSLIVLLCWLRRRRRQLKQKMEQQTAEKAAAEATQQRQKRQQEQQRALKKTYRRMSEAMEAAPDGLAWRKCWTADPTRAVRIPSDSQLSPCSAHRAPPRLMAQIDGESWEAHPPPEHTRTSDNTLLLARSSHRQYIPPSYSYGCDDSVPSSPTDDYAFSESSQIVLPPPLAHYRDSPDTAGYLLDPAHTRNGMRIYRHRPF